jgi:eukaryotic-like serine/threonine-protein kinase
MPGGTAKRRAALAGFLDRSRLPTRGLDLTLGRSGTLLGCCLLLEALVTADVTERDALRRYGDSTLEQIWKEIAGFPPISDGGGITYMGAAHGWAGVLYAALLWSEVTRTAPPPDVAVRLEQLARCGEPWGRGLRWSVRARAVNDYMAGWCNGSAGFVHLFTLAQRVTRDNRWTCLAERAGWNTWEADEPASTLCCGRGGRAYALLNLYRHTNDIAWLKRARDLVVRAATETVDGEYQGRGDSLYKGHLGVALVAADIEVPDQARMPFFEPEGWPIA